jgi:hypothetical protein
LLNTTNVSQITLQFNHMEKYKNSLISYSQKAYPFGARHVVFIDAKGDLAASPVSYNYHIGADSTKWRFFANYEEACNYVKDQSNKILICYKSNEPCKFDCKGLCKESC